MLTKPVITPHAALDDVSADQTVRVTTGALSCACGRTIRARDFDHTGVSVRLVCPACHRDLFEIELVG